MNKYSVPIRRVVQDVIEVEAETFNQAVQKVIDDPNGMAIECIRDDDECFENLWELDVNSCIDYLQDVVDELKMRGYGTINGSK